MHWLNRNKMSIESHRAGTILLYTDQIQGEGEFMTAVLNVAIRRLKETPQHPKSVEDFVAECEKAWLKLRK